ncbi:MAG TPA: hypothetical protein VF018_17465 [Acidobacteriaceae bacterium]
METRSVVRDVLLVAIAATIGWWVRGADTKVLANRSSSSSSARSFEDGNLGFQLGDGNPQQSLTIYNAESHTLYVYPRIGTGNAHISCEYSLRISHPGGPIDRQNCQMGSQY